MRGFSALILIVLVGALFAGASFLLRGGNVKGTSDVSADAPGFLVSVSSKSDTWELNLYGCTSETQCTRISKTGGGATELKEVRFAYSSGWDKYELLKVSVSPGQPGASESFKVLSTGDIRGSYIMDSAVFVPVDAISQVFQKSATFTDY